MKSPAPLVEFAPGASDKGIADAPRVLMLRKFCAQPFDLKLNIRGQPDVDTKHTNARKIASQTRHGYLAPCRKSTPASIRIVPVE